MSGTSPFRCERAWKQWAVNQSESPCPVSLYKVLCILSLRIVRSHCFLSETKKIKSKSSQIFLLDFSQWPGYKSSVKNTQTIPFPLFYWTTYNKYRGGKKHKEKKKNTSRLQLAWGIQKKWMKSVQIQSKIRKYTYTMLKIREVNWIIQKIIFISF